MSIEVTNADVSWGNTETVESTSDEVLKEVEELKSYLVGKVLTVVDATYADREQRKAMKDIVKSAFREKEYFSDNIVRILFQFAGKEADEYIEKQKGEGVIYT